MRHKAFWLTAVALSLSLGSDITVGSTMSGLLDVPLSIPAETKSEDITTACFGIETFARYAFRLSFRKDGDRDLSGLKKYLGDGSYFLFSGHDASAVKIMPGIDVPEKDVAKLLARGHLVRRPANPGQLIPIKLDLVDQRTNELVFSEVLTTAGVSGYGLGVLYRDLFERELHLDSYCITLKMMEDIVFPAQVKLSLVITKVPTR